MLSLAPLGADAAAVDYYIARTQGCEHGPAMTREALVDYYAGNREAAGVWVGTGAAALGLAGEIDPATFRELLLDGKVAGVQRARPRTKTGPDGTKVNGRVAGYDACLSAPKSVSLLYAFGDARTQGEVVAAHEHATRQAVRYLEGVGSHGRTGHAGLGERVASDGFIAASFRHRDARPAHGADCGDPALHTHTVIANVIRREDGQWRSVDSRALFRHGQTAGYVYQAELRAGLTERLGVAWQPVKNGMADVAGIDRPTVEHFSRRRHEIEAELTARGEEGAVAAQTATLTTRSGKAAGVDEPTLRDRWEAHGAGIGYGPEQVAELLDQAARRHRPQSADTLCPADLFGAEGLTRHASTFPRRDVLRALADACPDGATLDQMQARTDALLSTPDVLAVGDGPEQRYTTREMLAVEANVLALGEAGRTAGLGTVPAAGIDAALSAVPFELGADQAQMVRGLLTSGAAVEVVQAPAGTGKTTALSAARLGWEAAGYRVLGSATAARAARELADGGGIAESDTLARLLGDVEHADHGGFAPGTVLVVDEAGMVGSRVLERVLEAAARDQAKVVLVGDSKQLPEIDAGGAFRGLAERLGAHELTTNRRQTNEWERDALTLLRKGEAGEALDRYVANGRVTVADTTAGARALLAADWWSAFELTPIGVTVKEPGRMRPTEVRPIGLALNEVAPIGANNGRQAPPVMIAPRRVDVADLNGLARTLMAETGRLTGDALTADGKDYQAGDRIVCLKNDRRIGVYNGSRGTVSDVADGAMTVHLDTGADVTLPARYLAAGRVDHGYATTLHKAQGSTTGEAFVLGIREALSAEAGYVAMSRAKDVTKLYLVTGASTDVEHDMPTGPAQDAVDAAKWALAQSKAQQMATDAGPARQATADDLEGRLSDVARLFRNRPSGDPAEWADEHAAELAEAVTVGAELAWRGKADRVAVEADPAVRQAARDAPVRSLSRSLRR